MIRSTTYFIDYTNPRAAFINHSLHEGEAARMGATLRIQPCVNLNMDLTGSEIMRMLDRVANEPAPRYTARFALIDSMRGTRTDAFNNYGEMLAELSDPRREISMCVGVQEIEQLDDRDRMFVVTFYYKET